MTERAARLTAPGRGVLTAGNAMPIAVTTALLAGALDFVTYENVMINFLSYQVPIFVATWHRRWTGGVVTAVLCTALRALSLVFAHDPPLAAASIARNTVAEALGFAIVVGLVEVARVRTKETRERLAGTIEQLRHADRLNTIGKLAAGVAHEMGTPLNVIMGHAELIADERVEKEQVVPSARIILAQGEKMTRIVQQLLTFGRRAGQKRARADVRAIAKDAVALLAATARGKGIEVEVDVGEEPVVASVVPTEIEQVLLNLVVNAIQSTESRGVVRVSVARDARGDVLVAIRDTGSGIAPAHLSHIFDPFFTTKDVGEGTGLGLAVAYGIVADHGGRIEVESQLGAGSTFTVRLPA